MFETSGPARPVVHGRAGSLAADLGRPSAVIHIIDPPTGTSGFATAIERVVLANAHLALRQPHLARKLLEPLMDSDGTYLGPAVETRILLALAADRENRDSAALTLITEAIDLAEPEGLLQPFLEAWPPGGRPGRPGTGRWVLVIWTSPNNYSRNGRLSADIRPCLLPNTAAR
jgi:hypothetical protein